MTILITGASGFVGSAVLTTAFQHEIKVRPVFRTTASAKVFSCEKFDSIMVSTLAADTDWSAAVANVDVVIHCAARVHVMHVEEVDSLTAFRAVNVAGTLNLASQAARAGVKRFVFISSIKVNGESTQLGLAYTPNDKPAPKDAYGISKAEAEAGLQLLSQETGMEIVIIRPPLVYGPGVKGNFSSLLSWVARGLPLPLGAATTNRRSLVGLDNLVSLILTCVDHPKAANQTFLVSDGEDLSTADLLRRIGVALNLPVHLLPVPVSILKKTLKLLGKFVIAERLLGSLQVDISKNYALLNWKPSVSVDEGLRKAVQERL
jgi:nucleoside-diphosphate-sugar epimerase